MLKNIKKNHESDFKKFFNLYTPNKNPGKIWAIIGPPSSGKSRILGVLADLVLPDKIDSGIKPKKTLTGYMPQKPPFYCGSSLKKEAQYITGCRHSEDNEFLQVLLKIFHMEDVFDAPFKKLNDNMLQKAGILQAFLNKPETILLDEPLNRLDQEGMDEFIRLLKIYKKQFLKNNAITIASDKLMYLWDVVDEIIFITNKGVGERLTPRDIKKNLSVYVISENQCEELVNKNPDTIYRKTGNETVRLLLKADDVKEVNDIFLKEKDVLCPEDVYHFYCGKE
jgi:ABC-type multidrug transport system ATPase subunit